MRRAARLAPVLLALVSVAGAARAGERPILEPRTGRHYRFTAPAGWTAREDERSLCLAAADGTARAGFALVTGGQGTTGSSASPGPEPRPPRGAPRPAAVRLTAPRGRRR